MTTEDTEYVKELFNREIVKMRREVFELHESNLVKQFTLKNVMRARNHFYTIPISLTFNRDTYDMIIEFCEMERESEKNRME